MRKGRWVFTTAVILIAMAGAIAWLLWKPVPPEPVYQGKPLSFWLDAYMGIALYANKYPNGPPQPSSSEADAAIRAMGTKAIPGLMRRLAKRDSKTWAGIANLLMKQHLVKIHYKPTTEFWYGFFGLKALGPAASNTVPELIRMLERDPSPFAQQVVPAILGEIGPAAKDAVPVLLRTTAHTNWCPRNNALFALGCIHAEPEKVIPVLINCLSDTNIFVRASAIRALGAYGGQAAMAAPKLVELWRASPPPPNGTLTSQGWFVGAQWITGWGPRTPLGDTNLRDTTMDALKAISPSEAAKAQASSETRDKN